MMENWLHWSLVEIPSFALVIASTHLMISGGQTLLHCWLGHRRLGRGLFRQHINFHHVRYAKGHLASTVYLDQNDNTPYFLIPVSIAGAAVFFLLPLGLFIAMVIAAGASFYAHVYLDKAYHVEGSYLQRFAWFRRKQQLHFVHHLHANRNYAVIDFFWDRAFGTFRDSDHVARKTLQADRFRLNRGSDST